MDIIKKLKDLSAYWETRADSRMSDSYADATYDCVNDIDALILHAQEPSVRADGRKPCECGKEWFNKENNFCTHCGGAIPPTT
ncbi:MAG: hypothetical protein PVG39_02110 [Desulfobacteraceae bacterium]